MSNMRDNMESDCDDLSHASYQHNQLAQPIMNNDDSTSDSSIGDRVRLRRIPRIESDSESSSSVYKTNENEELDYSNEKENEEPNYDSESDGSFYMENGEAGEEGEDAPTQTVAQNKSPVKAKSAVSNESFMSNCSDGQSEKCPICLLSFTTQEVGTLESCNHIFCTDCIEEWSKNVNTCPVDRQLFTLILVRKQIEGEVVRKIPVETRTFQDDDEEIQEEPTDCEVCGRHDREDRMLLCDGCDHGYHLECLNPPLDVVPNEEWFCLDCILVNTAQFAEAVDMYGGEVPALIEDAASLLRSPPRQRLRSRTLHSERVDMDNGQAPARIEDGALLFRSPRRRRLRSRTLHSERVDVYNLPEPARIEDGARWFRSPPGRWMRSRTLHNERVDVYNLPEPARIEDGAGRLRSPPRRWISRTRHSERVNMYNLPVPARIEDGAPMLRSPPRRWMRSRTRHSERVNIYNGQVPARIEDGAPMLRSPPRRQLRSRTVHSERVNMYNGQVPARIEDGAPMLRSPPRRQLRSRTLHSERVRSNIQLRYRDNRGKDSY